MTEQGWSPETRRRISRCPTPTAGQVTLSALRGQQVIVYFYPAAMTPGCTKEACDFRDNLASLARRGADGAGHLPGRAGQAGQVPGQGGPELPAPVRPGPEVHKAYGAYGEKTMYGKNTVGVIRSTFVIGEDGKVARAYYNVKATGHVDRLLKDLAA